METRAAAASGIEWVTWINSIPKGRTWSSGRLDALDLRLDAMLVELDCADAAVSSRASIGGALRPSSRNNHGSAPT